MYLYTSEELTEGKYDDQDQEEGCFDWIHIYTLITIFNLFAKNRQINILFSIMFAFVELWVYMVLMYGKNETFTWH